MNITAQIARHFREVHFGGNWTSVHLQEALADVTWQQATAKLPAFNTILALTYHIHYYVAAVTRVLEGGRLDAHDKFSFDHPPINAEEDWHNLLNKIWADAETFATLIEQLPDSQLEKYVSEEKYGTWYRNLHGIIEHTHYHLGQIVIIKKMLQGVN